MNVPSELASVYYPRRHAALTADARTCAIRLVRVRNLLLLLVAITIGLLAGSLRLAWSGWPSLLPAVCILIALWFYLRDLREQERLLRLIRLYDQAIARLDGSQPQSGHTGEGFRPTVHLYDRDLAILGPDSLFGLLATVRTGVGQRGLANDLLNLPSREQTLERQQAVQELAPQNELREQIHLLGLNQFQQVAATFFDHWLEETPPSFHPAFRYLLVATSTVFFAGLIAGFFHFVAWSTLRPNLFAVLALQSVLGFYLRSRVFPILKESVGLSNQMQMFRDGLALLQAANFHSPKLIALQQISREPDNAVPALNKIRSHFAIVEQRVKGWFLIASLLLSAGTHAAISIANWKRRHAASMTLWLSAWAEFESLNAFATYAYEHPDNVYPEVLTQGTAIFEAKSLAHPLLPVSAVTNDIALDAESSLYLISGSNMAGKSTLLRAIGLNAILAACGAPVRAAAARISPLALGGSIALTDSLAEGKSKFLAEVERLHAILQLAVAETPVLFLIDEIFSGTNSLDRRIAAEAVATSLVRSHAIGALSTHDLTLTEMAETPSLHAVNLHMASPDPTNPLAFDYRLKPGVNPTSNALAILQLIGIEIR